MQRIFHILPDLAVSDSTILLLGESGTGKELLARAIHQLSRRKDKELVAVNCGALPDTLFGIGIIGYKAGAFTDAKKDKPGYFSRAEGGTLFLDEIGDVSPALQVKLLRVLQEKIFTPLGGIRPVRPMSELLLPRIKIWNSWCRRKNSARTYIIALMWSN
jgi:transcriptional regulator with PAS, ATPase and Fis domain